MPEYSSTTITPADGVQVPSMNGSTSGNFALSALKSYMLSSKGQANGLAGLDANGKLDPNQIPDSLDDVLVYATRTNFPETGSTDKLYITADTNKMYRWDDALATPDYVELSVDLSNYATKTELAAEESAREAEDTNLKNALDANTKRIENLEEKAGDYTEVQAKSVYSVPTGKASNMVLVGVDGRSRVKNNQAHEFSSTYYNIGSGSSVSDGVLTFSANSLVDEKSNLGIVGHHYLLAVTYRSTLSGTAKISNFLKASDRDITLSPSANWTQIASYFTCYANDTINFQVTDYVSGTLEIKDFLLEDMEINFNGSVPTGLDLATIQSSYPWLLTPSSYGTSMVKTRYEGFRSVFFNLWDEVWEVATMWGNTCMASKNMISVNPLTAYYLTNSTIVISAYGFILQEYDADGNMINQTRPFTNEFTTTAQTVGIKFGMFASYYGSVYNGDICINISGTLNGTYKPYREPVTLSLPTPIELGSVGSVAEKAYLNEDGEAWKTNPIGSFNGTEMTFIRLTEQGLNLYNMHTSSTTLGKEDSLNITNSFGLEVVNSFDSSTETDEVIQRIANDGSIYVLLKTTRVLSDFVANYELATPSADTPLTVLTDNWIATEGGGTLEATKTYPIDDSFTVGYLTL